MRIALYLGLVTMIQNAVALNDNQPNTILDTIGEQNCSLTHVSNLTTQYVSRTSKKYTKKNLKSPRKGSLLYSENKTERKGRPTRTLRTHAVPDILLHDINPNLLELKTLATVTHTTLLPNVTRKTRTTLYITPFTKRPGTTKPHYGCPICYKVFRKSDRLQLHMHKVHNLSIHVTIRRFFMTGRGPIISSEYLDFDKFIKNTTFLGEVQYDMIEEMNKVF
uniref:C2H2-type domain-containing protein n=1 Tax=Cacopsylla melanoneura TaxID=428564 RepID=A0A8D8WXR9_9HEMI